MLFHASAVSGQALRSLALDARAGIVQGRGGDFVDRGLGAAQVDVSGAVPIGRNAGVYVSLGYDWFGPIIPSYGDTCRIRPGNPSGGCLPSFPAGGGSTLTIGGAFALGTALELRAGLGAGAFSLANTRVGGVLAEGEAAFFPMAGLGIVARTRSVAIPRYHGDRLGLAHLSLGLRFRHSGSRSVKPNER
jgi:hypothetical protein